MSLVVAVLSALGGTAVPEARAYVYWTNAAPGSESIGRAELDGTGADQTFITGGTPRGLAVDADHIYWAGYGPTGSIGRANLDGTGANQGFITGATYPAWVAVDAAHIYWTNVTAGPDTIGRANLDGTGVDQSFITGASTPNGLAVDGAHIYWVNQGTDTIGRADLNGTGANQSFITGATEPRGLAVDAAHIYWANSTATIGRADLDGTDPNQSFISGAGNPRGVAVDAAHIYWANFASPGTIERSTLDVTVINPSFITGANGPYGVAVDSLPPPPSTTPPETPPGTPPGTAPGTLPPPSAARATISALSQTHRVFRVGARSTPLLARTTRRVPRGTTFSFGLDRAATVTVRIQRKLPGRRVGRTCRRPTRQLRHRPRCTRLVTKATLRRDARVGRNRIAFSGRVRGRALKPGRYRATFTATNTAGSSTARALSFRIVAP